MARKACSEADCRYRRYRDECMPSCRRARLRTVGMAGLDDLAYACAAKLRARKYRKRGSVHNCSRTKVGRHGFAEI